MKKYLSLQSCVFLFSSDLALTFSSFVDIISQAASLPVCESICSFCSRMKRGRMYACARREGYNVLAIGQHLDDIAERLACLFVFHILRMLWIAF